MKILDAKNILMLALVAANAGTVLADDLSEAIEVVRCTQKVWWENMPTTEIDLNKKVVGEYILKADNKHLYLVDGESNDLLAKMRVRAKSVYPSFHGNFVNFYGQSSGLVPSVVKSVNYDVERRTIKFEQNFIFGGESMFYSGTRECVDVRGDVTKLMSLFEDKKESKEGPLPRKTVTKTSDMDIIYFAIPGNVQENSPYLSSRCQVSFSQEDGADESSYINSIQSWEIGGLLSKTSLPVSRHVELCQGLASRFKNGYLKKLETPSPVVKKQLDFIPPFYQESNLPGLAPFERAILNPEPVTLVRPLNQWLCVAYFKQNDFYPGGGSSAQIQWRLNGNKQQAKGKCDWLLANYKSKYIDQLENPVQSYRHYFLDLVEDQHQ